jgi:cupin fold WbuC family metalloprotein|tara:strand:- start:5421 stop:5921 length:501 start_codon:yes stop_codon:yes gene_type:complete
MSLYEIPLVLRADLRAILAESLTPTRVSERKKSIILQHATSTNLRGVMCTAFQPGAYFRPHKHLVRESFLPIQGEMQLNFLLRDENGPYTQTHQLTGAMREWIVVPAGVDHTLQATGEDSAVYSIFHDVYDEATYKEELENSPPETAEEEVIAEYLRTIFSDPRPF